MVVVAGKLGDLLGRNRVLLGSVVVFVVGSVLCGLSQTMTMLAISRTAGRRCRCDFRHRLRAGR